MSYTKLLTTKKTTLDASGERKGNTTLLGALGASSFFCVEMVLT